ncbi:unnamed protein product, partial [Allacma fusca]
ILTVEIIPFRQKSLFECMYLQLSAWTRGNHTLPPGLSFINSEKGFTLGGCGPARVKLNVHGGSKSTPTSPVLVPLGVDIYTRPSPQEQVTQLRSF